MGVLSSLENLGWKEVVKITEFTKSLYPNDPARIDYPFFLLGREIGERRLTLIRRSLEELLQKRI
ncbi:hypothetical protein DRP04_08340 [Archaeoglobales archaeon]|nr:MAG: hypothetical protein DRP04_08340 [Archaeoglobales archaeon]